MRAFESGLINDVQSEALSDAIEKASYDPSYLSAISGAGPVEQFEQAFAKAAGGKYALALSSCTAALHAALLAIGVGRGDEVIVTPYSWGQSVAPVLFTGATAVFADIDPSTLTLDPNAVESRISNKTKAILPVHIFGNPADMDTLCSIAKKGGLAVISDAAQAFGALSRGRKMGSLGDAACFSLGRGKAVCGGEGGVLVTNNRQLYERAIAFTQHPLRIFRQVMSSNTTALHDELNRNYRIHPLAAVLALADLSVADIRVLHRKRILNIVHQQLESVPGVGPVLGYPGDCTAAYGVPLTYDFKQLGGISRESWLGQLQSKGIMIHSGPVRVPIHLRSAFQHGKNDWPEVVSHDTHKKGSCPVAEYRCEHQELMLFDACSLDKISAAIEMIKI